MVNVFMEDVDSDGNRRVFNEETLEDSTSARPV